MLLKLKFANYNIVVALLKLLIITYKTSYIFCYTVKYMNRTAVYIYIFVEVLIYFAYAVMLCNVKEY
jgi:hypothetical protein